MLQMNIHGEARLRLPLAGPDMQVGPSLILQPAAARHWAAAGPPLGPVGASSDSWHAMVCRSRYWRMLEWLLFVNIHDEVTYRITHGDKDTFRLAFSLAGEHTSFQLVSRSGCLQLLLFKASCGLAEKKRGRKERPWPGCRCGAAAPKQAGQPVLVCLLADAGLHRPLLECHWAPFYAAERTCLGAGTQPAPL